MMQLQYMLVTNELIFIVEFTADSWCLGVISGAKTNTKQDLQ
jgi:hypothetical protein